jgi:hypothetical protein
MSVRRRATVAARGWREAGSRSFAEVERFVLFVGWPRSAHTLVGSLLTAHPDAVVAHELNALRHVDAGVGRRTLFGLLLRKDRLFAEGGSKWTEFSYAVPGQWQGRHRSLRVIGDKKGGRTSLALHEDPALWQRFCELVAIPVSVVVVTRHPLDNIARMATRQGSSTEVEAHTYFQMADAVAWLAGQAPVFWMGHEAFVADPRHQLRGLTDHLGLDPDPGYLDAASGIVHESPRLARHSVSWGPGQEEEIMARAASYPFLAHYEP